MISPSALRNPLIHLRRHRRDREWLAATLQLLIPVLRDVEARVEFGSPIYAEPGAAVGEAVIEEDAAADGDQGDGVTSDVQHSRSPLVFLFITVFVDMIGYGIVVPLLPFYAELYASGALVVGLLASLYAVMQFAGGPFLGGLSDRHGRRPVLLLCLLGASLAYLLLGLAQTLVSTRRRRRPGRRCERHAGDSPGLHSRQHDEGGQGEDWA